MRREAVREALKAKEEVSKAILFNLSGNGVINLYRYEQYLAGALKDFSPSDRGEIAKTVNRLGAPDLNRTASGRKDGLWTARLFYFESVFTRFRRIRLSVCSPWFWRWRCVQPLSGTLRDASSRGFDVTQSGCVCQVSGNCRSFFPHGFIFSQLVDYIFAGKTKGSDKTAVLFIETQMMTPFADGSFNCLPCWLPNRWCATLAEPLNLMRFVEGLHRAVESIQKRKGRLDRIVVQNAFFARRLAGKHEPDAGSRVEIAGQPFPPLLPTLKIPYFKFRCHNNAIKPALRLWSPTRGRSCRRG